MQFLCAVYNTARRSSTLKSKKWWSYILYVYNIYIRELTIRMSVTIYMFLFTEEQQQQQQKNVNRYYIYINVRFIVDTVGTSLDLAWAQLHTTNTVRLWLLYCRTYTWINAKNKGDGLQIQKLANERSTKHTYNYINKRICESKQRSHSIRQRQWQTHRLLSQ